MRQREELFYLAYYLHWAWSETMTLTVEERKVWGARPKTGRAPSLVSIQKQTIRLKCHCEPL